MRARLQSRLPATPPLRASELHSAELEAKLEAARRNLVLATELEQASESREMAAREKAHADLERLANAAAPAGGMLLLSRDGTSGSLWRFARGTWDNPTLVEQDISLQAARLAPAVFAALMEDKVDESSLMTHLKGAAYCSDWCAQTYAGRHARILSEKHVLDAPTCDRLRRLVDRDRNRTKDTVDGFAQHQLSLTLAQLQLLVGEAAVARLQDLAPRLLTQRSQDARARATQAAMHAKMASGPAAGMASLHAKASDMAASRTARGDRQGATCGADEDGVSSREALSRALDEARASVALASRAAVEGYERITIFIRLYSRDTRPWIGFHTDLSTVTVNVALSADTSHEGGHLHAILEGVHQIVERDEGEATVHTDDVMHGVSAMRGGERYALILFFFREYRTNYDSATVRGNSGKRESSE